jgi:hypothetical protein
VVRVHPDPPISREMFCQKKPKRIGAELRLATNSLPR